MFRHLLMVCGLVSSLSLAAQSVPDTLTPLVQGPDIQFEKLTHDYGEMVQGASGHCEFVFKNIGSEPLIIDKVHGSCGCTVPQWSREPIMPGMSSVIKIHYDSNRIGYIGRSVTVYSNATSGRVVLRLIGNVKPRSH